MSKKILFVLPDYNVTTLRMLKIFEYLNYEISIVVPYKFTILLRLLLYFSPPSFLFIKKIKRRKKDWENHKPQKYKIISIPLYRLLFTIYTDKRKKRFYFSNTLKTLIEVDILKKINFKKFDIYYTFDSCAILYLDLAKKFNKKSFLECRGTQIDFALILNKKLNQLYGTSLDDIDNYKQSDSLKHWFWKIREEPKYADNLVLYSEFQKKQFSEHPSIIKIPIASNFKKKIKIKTLKKGEKVIFLFVGRVTFAKGIPNLIKAWKIIINKYKDLNAELNIVGSIDKETENIMSNLPTKINYLGYLFSNNLEKQYNKAHVMLFPTLTDSFGMVVLEALSYNLPIITTSNCGASEFIEHNKTGIVYSDIFSVEYLANSIELFLLNPDLVKKMSLCMKESVNVDYNYIKNIAKIELNKLF